MTVGQLKSVPLVVLIVAVLGLGSWVAYDIAGSRHSSTSPSQTPIRVLDLAHHGLTKVGAAIYDQSTATELVLSYNELTSLPSQMGKMTRLEVLKLDHNRLQGALIAEIRKMTQLRVLDARFNRMTGIPAEIGQLHKLRTLDLSHNRIDTLPNEIYHLRQLKLLDLTGNSLSAAQVSHLKSELPNTAVVF